MAENSVSPLRVSWVLRGIFMLSIKAKKYIRSSIEPSTLHPAGVQQMPLERQMDRQLDGWYGQTDGWVETLHDLENQCHFIRKPNEGSFPEIV